MHSTGLSEYDQKNSFPVFYERKSFFEKMQNLLKNTKKKPQHDFNADIRFNIEKNLNEYFLNFNLNKDWSKIKKD